jgi:hypothetical protein
MLDFLRTKRKKIQLSEHPTQIQTQCFPNTRSQRYRAASLLGARHSTSVIQAMVKFRMSDVVLTEDSRLCDVGLAVIKV